MGDATRDLVWVIGIFVALGLLWFFSGGPTRPASGEPFVASPLGEATPEAAPTDVGVSAAVNRPPIVYQPPVRPASLRSAGDADTPTAPRSPYADVVRLGAGNARYETKASAEYLTVDLSSSAEAPVTISGWRLVGDRTGARPIERDGRLVYPTGQSVVIPGGAQLYTGQNVPIESPIALAPGGQSVILSGVPLARSANPIKGSFQVNRCVGYLVDELERSDLFGASLRERCPAPEDEPGTFALDNECYRFVERLATCHRPEIKKPRDGPTEVDGVAGLSSRCRDYLTEHYNYQSCVKYHQADADFYTDEWRVFLKQPWELWWERPQKITLYDQNWLPIDEISWD